MKFTTPKAEVVLFATADILTASPTTEEETVNNCTTELPPDDF